MIETPSQLVSEVTDFVTEFSNRFCHRFCHSFCHRFQLPLYDISLLMRTKTRRPLAEPEVLAFEEPKENGGAVSGKHAPTTPTTPTQELENQMRGMPPGTTLEERLLLITPGPSLPTLVLKLTPSRQSYEPHDNLSSYSATISHGRSSASSLKHRGSNIRPTNFSSPSF